jgi:hypothetical protein
MSARRVLGSMSNYRLCQHPGVSIPEFCCRGCHAEQLGCFAPRVLRERGSTRRQVVS